MRNHFTEPDTARLTLADGSWVEIKASLSYGEDRALTSAGVTITPGPDGNPQVGIDLVAHALAKLRTYVVDWSFTDKRDRRVKPGAAAIANLTPETAQEIEAAIDRHLEATALGKASPAIEISSGATSPS